MPNLPALAPRPPGELPLVLVRPISKEHTEKEWVAKREVIERLYINDNLKLIDMIAIMASKHGFAATEQMYKKRLKKWNLRKRAYRKSSGSSIALTPPPTGLGVTDLSESDVEGIPQRLDRDHSCSAITRTPQVSLYAGLESVLDNVRTWSLCKLEAPGVSTDPMVRYLTSPDQPPIQDSRTMYRTFELVFDLWHYGWGRLAGIAARRGFHVLEFVLTEDHPDLVWHVLDTIYDMVEKGHIQLLGMFLKHASELSVRRLAREHPVVKILEQLITCDYQSQQGREYVCHLLRSAWLRNVNILGDHIGSSPTEYLWLYEQLIWDGRTRLRRGCELAGKQETMTAALCSLRLNQKISRPRSELDELRIMALTLEYTQMDIEDRPKAEELAVDLLNRTEQGMGESRSNARFHAYARKMLARLQEHRQDWAQAEENLRYAVEKRATAHGTDSDLRVIRDMWVLAGHYQRVGKDHAADQTVQDGISRAETFLLADVITTEYVGDSKTK
ncbi:hypothetical protein QQS21_011395 [Conoideocrella luteorostrata]|uniref:Clr5 domain-containing protein n=1 Tax=Conoideocrella luteorostrata TaxID=1105319 RepID=A0AAJ0CFY6_9HYPO|nr:hypothetical protein QQS21_011395 [Conoideocrella luteorostrata]